LRNYEFATFLRNRIFHKNANTPWRNFRISKKIQFHEIMWHLSIIVNNFTNFLGAHIKPPKLEKPDTFPKKLIFPKFRENETISKNRKFHSFWDGNVTYYDKQFIILRNYEFGTFLRYWVFHKNANTPTLTKFQNFEIIQITRNHVELVDYCK
jgi:hypothetical protein